MEQTSSSSAKRKRGRPRKYEYGIPPLHSTQDDSNIQQDRVQINHTTGASVGPNMRTVQALPTKQGQGNRSGRPRDSTNLAKTSLSHPSNYCSAPLKSNAGKDDIVGKYFAGKMVKKFPGFSLITVKVRDNQILKGWIPDEKNLLPITPKDDLAPELPMLLPSQVRKRPSTIYKQSAGPPISVHLEDVTFAKPLQMRRPVEKSVAKHMIPPDPRPYMGSGVVAATPISVSHSNSEPRTVSKQGTDLLNPQPLSSVMPIKSVQPVSASSNQVTDQDAYVGGKTIREFHREPESSDQTESSVKTEKVITLVNVLAKESPGERKLLNISVMDAVKESSDQIQHVDSKDMVDIKIASDPKEQPNATNSKQHTFMGPSEQSEQLETRTDIFRGTDGSNSVAAGIVPQVEASSTAHNPQGSEPSTLVGSL
ncbi:hypothetical protein GUJ93_ZPchr0004g39201 [Zizania palustris]|uniref:Uncharacterized protein n=1 Tax=Zizania palustris TaxID=103762 RepID=A0A8J5S2A1_ZIZPA|nr:hypothetical protein GUJ93_ZPchr0004g39201 [Zizania palustris]